VARRVARPAQGETSPPGTSHASLEVPVTADTLIAGRYRLESLAGRGGMGEVWKAVDTETGQPVALKRMLDAGSDSDRFTRESTLLSTVKHEALVGYVAHGVDGGVPWLAMAWVEGETLDARRAREGRKRDRLVADIQHEYTLSEAP